MLKTVGLLSGLLCSISAYADATSVAFDAKNWDVQATTAKFETYLGKKSLTLQSGFATVKGVRLENVIIEYDIAFTNKHQGYLGSVWRLSDYENYERFYLRTHSSGKPDSAQYTPFYNGVSAWQLYSSKQGDNYSATIKYDYEKWTHVKIIVSGEQVEIYMGDMEKPVLFVEQTKGAQQAGKFGFSTEVLPKGVPFVLENAHYADFSYTPIKANVLKSKVKPATKHDNIIKHWQVSNAFSQSDALSPDDSYLKWTKITADNTGLVNLARVQGAHGTDTAFAQVTITSDKKQVSALHFGFNDRVKVYLNGQIIYSGNNTMGSRDYRFLGTMGYFDTLYLPLNKGKNTLSIAVTETAMLFDGWGIQAKFEDMTSIKFSD